MDKRAEAIKRMEILGIPSKLIQRFEKGNVYMWESFGAHKLDADDRKRIRLFEKKYDAIVYAVIRTYAFESRIVSKSVGMMDSFLFISRYDDERDREKEDLKRGSALAYVYNHDAPECSEMGMIGIRTLNGLERTW